MREIYRSLLFLELRKKTHVLHKLILIVVFDCGQWWLVNIDSGKGFVLTYFCENVWHH